MRSQLIIILFFLIGSFSYSEVLAEQVCFTVKGMTCSACGVTLKAGVKKLEGVTSISSSYETKSAEVSFNPQLVNSKEIRNAINNIGYKATEKECSQVSKKEG